MTRDILRFYSMFGNTLVITSSEVFNLVGLPSVLPKIKTLEIRGREINGQTPVPMNFRSFKGLPDFLPQLEDIEIYDSSIQNLESLTIKTPLLKEIRFINCNILNLKGTPKKPIEIYFFDCKIDSFEGLDANHLNITDITNQRVFLIDTSFSSFYGIHFTTLHAILIEYFSRFGNFYNLANLTPKGMELLNECINREIYNTNSPLEFVRINLPFIAPDDYFERENRTIDSEIKRQGIASFVSILNERGFNYHSNREWNERKDPNGIMESWVYGRDLEEELFIPEKIDQLLKFYEKSPAELALQYRSNTKSLSNDQIDRLIHEANHKTLQILEDDEFSTLQKGDAVIFQISHKFAINTENGKVYL